MKLCFTVVHGECCNTTLYFVTTVLRHLLLMSSKLSARLLLLQRYQLSAYYEQWAYYISIMSKLVKQKVVDRYDSYHADCRLPTKNAMLWILR